MQNSQETANRIKERAKIKGVSISKLLLACELNKNAIFTMQSSGYYPRVEAITKIADYLDCSVDYLLGRTNYPEINNGQFEYDGVKLEGTIIPVKGGYIHLDNGAALPPEAIAELEKRLQTKK